MRIITIPDGIDTVRNNVNRRDRFFDNLYTIVELSQLSSIEIFDLAQWFQNVIDLRTKLDVQEIKLKDGQYEKLKAIIGRFEGYRGLGATDVVLAIHNAHYIDETKELTELQKGVQA